MQQLSWPAVAILDTVQQHDSGLGCQVGLLITSPIFAQASKHLGGFRLIAMGLVLWTVSTAGAGLAIGGSASRLWQQQSCAHHHLSAASAAGYRTLLLARCIVGVGEASFVALAAPFIGANAYRPSPQPLSMIS